MTEHLSVTVTFDDNTFGNIADHGWGQCYQLISNEDLHKATPTCQFLKDDCVYFEITFHK